MNKDEKNQIYTNNTVIMLPIRKKKDISPMTSNLEEYLVEAYARLPPMVVMIAFIGWAEIPVCSKQAILILQFQPVQQDYI